ncbi:MAG TPA: hypothetical protein VE398_10075 [Acidobacteriota bacterium]|nr:hypothetical protein [Acidobacteriota bacterium]
MKPQGVWIAVSLLAFAFAATLSPAQSKKSQTQARPPAPVYRSRANWTGFSADQLLQQIDADHDGVITHEEWERFFRDHDENKDDRLAQEEIQAAAAKEENKEETDSNYGRERAFQKLDANRDDVIQRNEWPGNDRSFSRMDANHDGVLSREEFMSMNGRYWNEVFEDLDFNNDGLISRDEWLDSEIAFQRLDHNHNGVIDKFEFYTPR